MNRVLKLAAAAMLLTSAATGAYAQSSNCGEIKNNADRLSCYDKATSSTTTPDGYRRVNLIDLKVDKKAMQGQRIEVEGYAMIVGDTLMLNAGMADMNVIMVEYKNLPRDQRRPLYECEMMCHVLIRGRVESASMYGFDTGEVGINADSITRL